jgi:predicted Zn-dependent protease
MNIKYIEQYVRTHCSADDYVCYVTKSDTHETRFAQNGITQHLAGPKMRITLSVAFGTKNGSCSVNLADEANLKLMVKTAEDIARLAPEDPEAMPSPAFTELPKVQNCAEATKALTPLQMVEIVQQSINKARTLDATVSGMCEKHLRSSWMFSKNGFSGSDESSTFGHSMTLKKKEVETKVSYEAKDFAGFNLDRDFDRLAAQAEALKDMHSFDPQKIAVILRPEALEELIWFMTWMMNRRQSDEGLTPFTGKLDSPCFGDKFSLYSTLQKPEMIASPYNGEGLPSKESCWVEHGVLKNMPVNRWWAKQVGCEPMDAFNFYVPGGDTSEAEMMKMVPRGLIINRFWYIRTVDMKAGELTGMTRDGVLYFENGEVKHAVNNLRFNEIPHEMTRRILALGKAALASPYAVLPTLLVDGFNFVDKTSF